MTDIRFGRLTDLPLNEAWPREDRDFTPWLADNIDHLAEAIGIPLELTGTEVAVESFSADILARNPKDDGIVLIENQYGRTDHKHLGQIMTYLAGLEAQTVVWIASDFHAAHLSAIRWLNEHTADGFSFFAVRARVVRIGDSPYAPIFEVVEQPDGWARKVKSEAGVRDLRPLRNAYFEQLLQGRNEDFEQVGQKLYFPIAGSQDLFVVAEIGGSRVGLYVAAKPQMEFGSLTEEILRFAPDIEVRLGPIKETRWGGALFSSASCNLEDDQTWPDTIEWQNEKITTYLNAFQSAGSGPK